VVVTVVTTPSGVRSARRYIVESSGPVSVMLDVFCVSVACSISISVVVASFFLASVLLLVVAARYFE
jgi:hypothetical protein